MNQGNIDTLNDLFKEYRVEFQMIALIPVKLDWRLFMKIYLNIPVPHGYGTAVMNIALPKMELYIL